MRGSRWFRSRQNELQTASQSRPQFFPFLLCLLSLELSAARCPTTAADLLPSSFFFFMLWVMVGHGPLKWARPINPTISPSSSFGGHNQTCFFSTKQKLLCRQCLRQHIRAIIIRVHLLKCQQLGIQWYLTSICLDREWNVTFLHK